MKEMIYLFKRGMAYARERTAEYDQDWVLWALYDAFHDDIEDGFFFDYLPFYVGTILGLLLIRKHSPA